MKNARSLQGRMVPCAKGVNITCQKLLQPCTCAVSCSHAKSSWRNQHFSPYQYSATQNSGGMPQEARRQTTVSLLRIHFTGISDQPRASFPGAATSTQRPNGSEFPPGSPAP